MDEQELKLLEKLAPQNPELQALWDQHTLLKKQTDKLDSKKFLSPQDETLMKEFKKEKLDVKTNLLSMLRTLA